MTSDRKILNSNFTSKENNPIIQKVKCFYCLRNPTNNNLNSVVFLKNIEITNNSPYIICSECWSILNSQKFYSEALFKLPEEIQIKKKSSIRRFKFSLIGLDTDKTTIIRNLFNNEDIYFFGLEYNYCELAGFKNSSVYFEYSFISLQDISSKEQFLHLHNNLLKGTSISILMIDVNHFHDSSEYIVKFHQRNFFLEEDSIKIVLFYNFSGNTGEIDEFKSQYFSLNIDHYFTLENNDTFVNLINEFPVTFDSATFLSFLIQSFMNQIRHPF